MMEQITQLANHEKYSFMAGTKNVVFIFSNYRHWQINGKS